MSLLTLPSFTGLRVEFDGVIEVMMTAVEARDAKLRRHGERVARAVWRIGQAFDLPLARREALYLGALLHDVGNIGIPDSILLKPTGLTSWEFDEMKLHTIIGERICGGITPLEPALALVRSHHEKLDGSGYPDGLRGGAIAREIRILSVADVYDTLRLERSYRDAFSHEQALDILRGEAQRGWWDDEVVECLAEVVPPIDDFSPV